MKKVKWAPVHVTHTECFKAGDVAIIQGNYFLIKKVSKVWGTIYVVPQTVTEVPT